MVKNTIEKTAEKGNTLETLIALRQKIAKTLDTTNSGRDIAALSRQLQLILTQIDELQKEKHPEEGETVLEMIRKKHENQRVRPSKEA